jgi:cytoskeleton protein RodZ
MQDRDGEPEREAHGETGKKLTSMLQAARTARGLSLEEIAAELRMEPRRLQALEECRFDELGPPVYAKGYLKQYGHRLGLNYDDLLAEYYRLVAPQDLAVAPVRTIKLHDERQITVWIVAALTIALLGVFLMVWWLDEPVRDPTPVVTPAAVEETDIAPPVVEGADAVDLGAEPQSDAPPVDEEADAGAAEEVEVAPPEDQSEALATAPAGEPQVTGPSASIDIVFLEDCWVEVTDARGANVLYGLGRAGTRSTIAAQTPVEVFLGNARGVEVTIDGQPFDLPRRTRQGNLARFSIDGRTD